ncbi:transient receptor potential cation channel subfamily M member 5 [Gadus chalcogrammus]|uniref:transient receptor potential cation channel subfamily M member 5 n=1 Tax=Gadus chalcogrammus TaxID=1042646 RepID=UPI0024C4CE95|nr:transient receptor potential cation channel subfamily M member 5 [Gadus chalcogrammus]
MQGTKDTPMKTFPSQSRCLRCGDYLEWSEEHSGLLGCQSCDPPGDPGPRRSSSLTGREDMERSQWAAGRVGDVEFTGPTRTKAKFVRVQSSTDPVLIYRMLTEQWGLAPPHLVVALVGGDELAQMKPWLRNTVRKGLVKAAQSTGAWFLTNGLRFGITKHLGQAVRDHSLASTSSKVRVVAIGIAPWSMIHNREALLSAKPDNPAVYKSQDLPHGSVYALDSNHSHLVLVEEDPQRPGATSDMRVKLLKHISLQRTGHGGAGSFEIPVLCLLVHGEPRILTRMITGIGNSSPWLILAGSGGVADILVTLLSKGSWDADSVQELLSDTFPGAHHASDLRNWIKQIQKILDHGHLLTVHDPEQESSELDTVILKALVKACKSQSQQAQDFLDELKLAVAWNRVDIAKSDIFNGDVEWQAADLEEVMMDALVNDKPDFVRLFVDNGVNLGDFLTYGRLQELYWAVSEKSLLYHLLLKKYQEKQLLLKAARSPGPPGHHPPEQGERKPRFTLHEVSKVLKDFLHDSCKGFYQKIPTEKPAKGRLFHSQKSLAELEECCEHPWRDLFLWAVLQNRQQMANYFWAMMKDVFFFLFFLSVWMIAYGVATQALLHPNDPRIDWVFRRALYRPYLHIFGQIPLEEIDAARMPDINCTDVPEEIIMGTLPPCPNIYANWLVILLLVIFLLVTNVLLLNLLIAMFSYTFQVVQEHTDIYWKYQRYHLIVEYHSRPALAPPFIIISHLSQLLLSVVKRTEPKQEHLEGASAGLDQRLMTWETVQKENYLAHQECRLLESSEERLRSTSSKVQSLLRMAGGFKDQEKRMVSVEAQVRYCGEVLSWLAECFAQSTLKCGRDAPKSPMSLSGAQVGGGRGRPQAAGEEEAEAAGPRARQQGYGANKKFPYIDEEKR